MKCDYQECPGNHEIIQLWQTCHPGIGLTVYKNEHYVFIYCYGCGKLIDKISYTPVQ